MNFKILKLLDLKFYFCAFCAFLRLYHYSIFSFSGFLFRFDRPFFWPATALNPVPRTLLALRSPEGEEGNPEPRTLNPEDRGQKTEVRSQRSDGRSQKTEDRRETKRSLEVKKLRG